MLAAIASLERAEASEVLARAAQIVLRPDTSSLTAQGSSPNRDLPMQIVGELKDRVAARAKDAEDLLRQLSEELSREISECILSGVDLKEVRERAGEKGKLPTTLYDVVFTPHFIRQEPLQAIKQSYVVNAIAHPGFVEHLHSTRNVTANGVSLFLQSPRIRGLPYTLLIKSSRIGDRFLVEDAFYLFHDTFDLSARNSPGEALDRFLALFGVPIKFEETIANPLREFTSKFPENGRVVFQNIRGGGVVTLHGEPGQEFTFLLGYSVNQEKYMQYLREHGIKSRMVPPMTTITNERI